MFFTFTNVSLHTTIGVSQPASTMNTRRDAYIDALKRDRKAEIAGIVMNAMSDEEEQTPPPQLEET